MALEEIQDSVKTWFDERLKNPYIASVLAVWLITNRVVVYGLFNFNQNQGLQERISWIHQQLQHNKVYPLKILGREELSFEGFYSTIFYSFFLGLITMVLFRYVNVIGKATYAILGKGANSLTQKIKPEKWRPIEEVIELKKLITTLETTLEKNQRESREVKQDKETGLLSISKLNSEKLDLKKENDKLKDENSQLTNIKKPQDLYKSSKKTIFEPKENSFKTMKEIETSIKPLKEIEELIKPQKNLMDAYKKDQDNLKLINASLKEKSASTLQTVEHIEEIKRKEEIKIFMESDFSKYFDEIYSAISNHVKLDSKTVPDKYKDYYILNGLISLKDNLYILTSLGNEYYKEYLKIKTYPSETNPQVIFPKPRP